MTDTPHTLPESVDLDTLLIESLGTEVHASVVRMAKQLLMAALSKQSLVLLIGGDDGLGAVSTLVTDKEHVLQLLTEACNGIAAHEVVLTPGGTVQ